REDIAQQRVPPRRVIEHDDRRPAESRRRRSGLRDTYGVKVPGDVPASVAAEQAKQPPPARRQPPTREPVRAGGRGRPAPQPTPPAPTVPGPSRDGVMSRARASAAIQPDISTIGIPGPGCAAPPTRYRPGTSGERLAGLNAPSQRPWLASP